LFVWPTGGRNPVLLVGYELLPTLREYHIRFWVVEKKLADKHQAWLFVIKYHLDQPSWSPVGESYLCGVRYHAEKLPHGVHRPTDHCSSGLRGKTPEDLPELQLDAARYIRRDAEVVTG